MVHTLSRIHLSWRHFSLLITLTASLLFSGLASANINNWVNNAEAGVFLMHDHSGEPQSATALNTDVTIEVSGLIAHVTLTQRFHNTGQAFAEGLYVFPLSERAAVNAMEMQIGERRIVGEIHEKQRAREIFEQAKREGKRTGLVEQRRPNVFTTSVANIAPNDEIVVRLEYIEVLERDGNQFNLRFPMTITPRYRPASSRAHPLDLPLPLRVPADETPEAPLAEPPSSAVDNSLLARMADVSGPFTVNNPQPGNNSHTARIHVTLDGGLPVSQLYSRSHAISSQSLKSGYRISPQDTDVPMDRDFLLSWTLAPHHETEGVIFSEMIDGEDYALLMLVPPKQIAEQDRLAREMLFIIDTSGSMGGESIRQAKSALQAALKRLYPGDRFNIVEFNSDFSTLYPQPVAATPSAVDTALRFVHRLDAGGGTEMLAPLKAALNMQVSEDYLRQVVFITDGSVGNEHAIFQTLHKQLGTARLFTVGIGSAPNSYFMRKAAEFGLGTFTYINSTSEVQTQMAQLFSKLEKPLMRDIKVQFPNGTQVETFPPKIPDLYSGEPVMLAMKFNQLPAWIKLSGRGNQTWNTHLVPTPTPGGHRGVGVLWARQKIEALTDRITRGEPEADMRPLITEVALRHKLLSRYTSFVAVDHTPVRTGKHPLKRQDVANRLPKGLKWPSTATGVDGLWHTAALLLLACLALLWRRRKAYA